MRPDSTARTPRTRLAVVARTTCAGAVMSLTPPPSRTGRSAARRARSGTPGGRQLRRPVVELLAPMVCATPRTMPPASVPQSDPSPPMITASKAKISRPGRRSWRSSSERRGRRRRGRPYRRRCRRDHVDRSAVDAHQPGGLGVVGWWPGRLGRLVRPRKSESDTSTSTATTNRQQREQPDADLTVGWTWSSACRCRVRDGQPSSPPAGRSG